MPTLHCLHSIPVLLLAKLCPHVGRSGPANTTRVSARKGRQQFVCCTPFTSDNTLPASSTHPPGIIQLWPCDLCSLQVLADTIMSLLLLLVGSGCGCRCRCCCRCRSRLLCCGSLFALLLQPSCKHAALCKQACPTHVPSPATTSASHSSCCAKRHGRTTPQHTQRTAAAAGLFLAHADLVLLLMCILVLLDD